MRRGSEESRVSTLLSRVPALCTLGPEAIGCGRDSGRGVCNKSSSPGLIRILLLPLSAQVLEHSACWTHQAREEKAFSSPPLLYLRNSWGLGVWFPDPIHRLSAFFNALRPETARCSPRPSLRRRRLRVGFATAWSALRETVSLYRDPLLTGSSRTVHVGRQSSTKLCGLICLVGREARPQKSV